MGECRHSRHGINRRDQIRGVLIECLECGEEQTRLGDEIEEEGEGEEEKDLMLCP